MNSRMLRHQAGMSFLELIVVFVIVSLVSTLIVQGIGFGLVLYSKVDERAARGPNELLVRAWVRDVVGSLVAQPGQRTSLVGDSAGFEGMTLSPLLSEGGTPVSVSFQIADRGLLYIENQSEIVVKTLPADASWEYLNKEGNWGKTWPENSNLSRLPEAIRLVTGTSELTASVDQRLVPDELLEDSKRDRE